VARRIAIQYGDAEFAVSGRELDEVKAEIEAGMKAQTPTWLKVAIGQGRATEAFLLLAPGIPISVWQVNIDGPESGREPDTVDEPVG